MLFKNDKQWASSEWEKHLPKFKLPVVFKLKSSYEKEFENGKKVPVYNDESFEKKAFLLINNEQCTIVQGVQQMKGDNPIYQDSIMNFENGTWVANTPEELFIGFYHLACDKPEENKEFFENLSPRRSQTPRFYIYDAKVIAVRKANENKMIAKVVGKMYDMEEKKLRAMYIADGFGEHEPNASLEDIQLYYEPLIRQDVTTYFDKFFANDDSNEIASIVYGALKKGTLEYKKTKGEFRLAGAKEAVFLVPEGLREAEMANKALITWIESATDKTILVALRGK